MNKNECSSCGETKCSCKNKDFTKAVIEIDNPEKITLMRRVVIPTSMGDDTVIPPAIGKYHNVLLNYEANNKSYLYSSDGIPTLLTGAQGEQGPAGTVTIGATTTGEPGSDASVENVGTPENAILNFTVPQGPRVPEEEVQEDVDNKLDEMYEDGTLTDIINEFIGYSKNSYIIPEIESYSINLVNNKGNVYITHIPNKNSDGEVIKMKHGFANDTINSGLETPTDFSYRKNATFVANASVYNSANSHPPIPKNNLLGLYIHDGSVLYDNRQYLDNNWFTQRYILGFEADNTMHSYIGDTSAETILADNVVETITGFIPIMINGVNNRQQLVSDGCTYWESSTFAETADEAPVANKIYYTLDNGEYLGHFDMDVFEVGVTYYEETDGFRYNRQVICQKENGDIYFITNNGKGSMANIGMTLYEFVTMAQYLGCKFAFVLDGGGSTASVDRNIMLNYPTDGSTTYQSKVNGLGKTIRAIPDFLYFSKDMETETDVNTNFMLERIQYLNKKIHDNVIDINQKAMTNVNLYSQDNEQVLIDKKSWDPTTNTFKSRARIYWDNYGSFPQGLSINKIDQETNQSDPILRIYNNEDQGIEYFRKKLGLMFNEVQQFATGTNLDDLGAGFVVGRSDVSKNLNGAPIVSGGGEGYNYMIIQFGWDTIKVQIAFSIHQDAVTKIRVFTTAWGTWKKVTLT